MNEDVLAVVIGAILGLAIVFLATGTAAFVCIIGAYFEPDQDKPDAQRPADPPAPVVEAPPA